MERLLWIVIVILLVIIFTLAVKICFLRLSAKEITAGFHERLKQDTNT
ncbi:MAG: hypothetical protein ACI32N_04455 [Bulleidia sp.]